MTISKPKRTRTRIITKNPKIKKKRKINNPTPSRSKMSAKSLHKSTRTRIKINKRTKITSMLLNFRGMTKKLKEKKGVKEEKKQKKEKGKLNRGKNNKKNNQESLKNPHPESLKNPHPENPHLKTTI